jgi:hypothetical protein
LPGVADAAMKGHHGGTRDAIGNVSAPWLILPLLAGAIVAPRRPAIGALVGMVSVLLALAGFYVIGGQMLGLGIGPHSIRHPVTVASALGSRWLQSGTVAGLGLGAIGAWLAGRRSFNALGWSVAALLVFEPAARGVYLAVRGPGLTALRADPGIWLCEVAVGVALTAALWLRPQRRGARPEAR